MVTETVILLASKFLMDKKYMTREASLISLGKTALHTIAPGISTS